MKKIMTILLVFSILTSCKNNTSGNNLNVKEIQDTTDYTLANQNLFQLLKEEKQVKKVDTFNRAVLLYLDYDGTTRGGYAMAMCNYLSETGSKNFNQVWIMERGSENKKENTLKQGRIMGMCDCETFEIKY